jgi:kinesin family protein 1
LKLSQSPIFRENANGTKSLTIYAQWDSSVHNSLLLDRVTQDKYRVQMTISWEISSEKLAEPMKFSQKVCVQILSRTFVRQTSMFSALWQNIRFVRSSTGIFTLTMRPAPIKKVGDLWRLNSQHDYVKGEENLTSWTPRGVSLVSDFITARRKKRRAADIVTTETILAKLGFDGTNAKLEQKEPSPSPSPELKPIIPSDDDLLHDTPETSPAPSLHEEEVQEAALDEGEPEEPKEPKEEDELKEGEPKEEEPKDGNPDDKEPKDGESKAEEQKAENAEDTTPEATTEEDTPIKVEEPQPKPEYDEKQTDLLQKCLKLWKKFPDPLSNLLSPANIAPPTDGLMTNAPLQPTLVATVIRVPKNPKVLKGGYLLVPNSDSTRWVKRFVELRRPYLHLHSAGDGDEVGLVSLRNSRIDSQPGVLALLNGSDDYDNASDHSGQTGGSDFTPGHRRTSSGRVISTIWTGTGGGSSNGGPGLQRLPERMQSAVFAIYGTDNTWLFAARSERDKMDWIFRIDQTYLSGNDSLSGSGMASPYPGSEY